MTNTIYRHKVLRINYTTYDMRRTQDSLNPRIPGHGDIMVLSPENENENEDPHPYWYARILGIYHADIRYTGPNSTISWDPQRMEFLFVRWFGRDLTPQPGWKAKCLVRLAFAWGHVTKYLPERSIIARGIKEPDDDWQLYYVAM